MANWRAVHVSIAGDDLKIDGLEVWKETWRSTDSEPVVLPHPAYPNQRHQFEIYEIGDSQKPIRFAAGELSNGVYGFYFFRQ